MGVCIAHVELGVPFPAQMNMFVPFTFCSLLDSSSLTFLVTDAAQVIALL
jgi:hypothetical protein